MLPNQGMSATIAHFKAKKRGGEEREHFPRRTHGYPGLAEASRRPRGYKALPFELLENTGGYEGFCLAS